MSNSMSISWRSRSVRWCRLSSSQRQHAGAHASMVKRSWIMSGSNVAVPIGGSYPNASIISRLQNLYKDKKQVWVIFADVGTPLSEVQNHTNTLFTALMNALKGEIPCYCQPSLLTQLQVLSICMFIGHYVHQDISTGNVLLCGEMAKISNLEYVKKFL